MAFLGFRAYPTPIMKPLWPFFAASGLVYYAVSKIQYAGVRSGEYAKDPKNPYAKQIAKEAHH
ncbi:Similar to S.cerevisiae protein ATP18 (Subunit of the mitochondrial F1F0 ATP synthase) [Malassezia sympodialis ATCC 42132]|uniref:Similar to S.cerevisiae protein ATP18 (Subunit of the mitochondrial F1F0 ATP synthase) n=1 Tax=Malassezia sympodialis (strain ATCC 42132) TaxID=1230383 RepID=A0A1M8A5V5_MALS4|nr:Similar to S.cerevisiae protein ATP18 (Subunit of the mitochondrial F1F0 ATP synthase) [Malassezia sympodialis ATCC 42132]